MWLAWLRHGLLFELEGVNACNMGDGAMPSASVNLVPHEVFHIKGAPQGFVITVEAVSLTGSISTGARVDVFMKQDGTAATALAGLN